MPKLIEKAAVIKPPPGHKCHGITHIFFLGERPLWAPARSPGFQPGGLCGPFFVLSPFRGLGTGG